MPVTMENTKIEHHDFSKTPPGYVLELLDDGMWWWGETEEWPDGTSYRDQKAAIAAAWAHYKARHDPPGLEVFCWPKEKGSDPPTSWCVAPRGHRHVYSFEIDDPEEGEAEARAAAWAWYDRRVGLARQLDIEFSGGTESWWPRCLTWSDEQVAAVECRLAGGGEVPEVLRG